MSDAAFFLLERQVNRILEKLAGESGWEIGSVPSFFGNAEFAIGRRNGETALLAAARMRKSYPDGLCGEVFSSRTGFLTAAPIDAGQAALLRRLFPWCAPTVQGGLFRLAGAGATAGDRLTDVPFFTPDSHGVKSLLTTLTFAVFATGHPGYYALELPLNSSSQLIGESGLFFRCEADSAASEPMVAPPELLLEYENQTFVADGEAIRLDATTLGECMRVYPAMLKTMRRLHRRLSQNPRTEFCFRVLPLRPEPAHVLFLTRELCKRGIDRYLIELPLDRMAAASRAAMHFGYGSLWSRSADGTLKPEA